MSKTSKIYVVIGSCGEYSDHSEWPVCYFTKEEDAKEYVVKCTEIGNKIRAGEPGFYNYAYIQQNPHPLDPQFRWDYSGFNYNYYCVEKGKLP